MFDYRTHVVLTSLPVLKLILIDKNLAHYINNSFNNNINNKCSDFVYRTNPLLYMRTKHLPFNNS